MGCLNSNFALYNSQQYVLPYFSIYKIYQHFFNEIARHGLTSLCYYVEKDKSPNCAIGCMLARCVKSKRSTHLKLWYKLFNIHKQVGFSSSRWVSHQVYGHFLKFGLFPQVWDISSSLGYFLKYIGYFLKYMVISSSFFLFTQVFHISSNMPNAHYSCVCPQFTLKSIPIHLFKVPYNITLQLVLL